MNTTEKIKLLQELLERRYPADIYDMSEKTSIFRLRVDKILSKLDKLEEVNNHEQKGIKNHCNGGTSLVSLPKVR